MSDGFKGDNAALCESIDAMLGLNAAGALTPRVPAMAVQLLTSASVRLAMQHEDIRLAALRVMKSNKMAGDPEIATLIANALSGPADREAAN